MLYLIRHGTTTFNSRGADQEVAEKIRGWLPLSLDENGKQQARNAGMILRDRHIAHIYSSTLQRAAETADIISETIAAPDYIISVKLHDGLTPWDIGNIAGTLVVDAIPIMTSYFDSPLVNVPEGESYSMFYNRWKILLYELIHQSENKNICAVTHSRNLYCLDHILTNGKKPITFTGVPVPGGIVEIESRSLDKRIL